jgi:hypothetical protein
MSENHRARTHQWIDGKLTFKDIWFSTLKDAKDFIEDVICDEWKLFDCDDTLVDCGKGHDHHHHGGDDGYCYPEPDHHHHHGPCWNGCGHHDHKGLCFPGCGHTI